jgi:hypothetical protein
MKRIRIIILFFILTSISIIYLSFDKGDEDSPTSNNQTTDTDSDWKCGTYNGHQLWTGPKGGCYYYNSNNNKTYIDRSYCNCTH